MIAKLFWVRLRGCLNFSWTTEDRMGQLLEIRHRFNSANPLHFSWSSKLKLVKNKASLPSFTLFLSCFILSQKILCVRSYHKFSQLVQVVMDRTCTKETTHPFDLATSDLTTAEPRWRQKILQAVTSMKPSHCNECKNTAVSKWMCSTCIARHVSFWEASSYRNRVLELGQIWVVQITSGIV